MATTCANDGVTQREIAQRDLESLPPSANFWCAGLTLTNLLVAVAAVITAWTDRIELALLAMLVSVAIISLSSRKCAGTAWPVARATSAFLAFAVAPSLIVLTEAHDWIVGICILIFCASALRQQVRHALDPQSELLGIPTALAANIALMPTLLGLPAALSTSELRATLIAILCITAIGMSLPLRLPAMRWRWSRREPNLVALVTGAAAISYFEKNIWAGLAWLPVVGIVLYAAWIMMPVLERALFKTCPVAPSARLQGARPWAVLLMIAGVAPTIVAQMWDEPDTTESPTAFDTHGTDVNAPTEVSAQAIHVGFQGELGEEDLPPPWRLFQNPLLLGGRIKATAIPQDDGTWAMRLATSRSSFAIDMNCDPDPDVDWDLTWDWHVDDMPPMGDIRDPNRGDAALQIGVYFDTKPWDPSKPDLTPDGYSFLYTWDSNAPVDTIATRTVTYAGFTYAYKVWVLRSGTPDSDAWYHERRNLREDFVKAYGFDPPPIRGVRVQCTSLHTKSKSSGMARDIWLVPKSQ